jgi:hypothetical protein
VDDFNFYKKSKSKKKYYLRTVAIYFFVAIVSVSFFMLSKAAAQDNYTPIYDKGWVVNYKDLSGEWTQETRRGFNQFFDPDDPVLICQTLDENACEAPPPWDVFSMPLASEPTGYPDCYLTYDYFKIFIPPGTIEIDFVSYPPQDDLIGYAVRYGSPVQGNYDSLDSYSSYNWESTPRYLSSFEGRDVLIRNAGGNISVMGKGVFPEVEEGGWLYVRVLRFDPMARIVKFKIVKKFNKSTYVDWFRNAEFDKNGNPTGGGNIGTGLDELDENNNGKVDMGDAILKLQNSSSDPNVDLILQILSGQ